MFLTSVPIAPARIRPADKLTPPSPLVALLRAVARSRQESAADSRHQERMVAACRQTAAIRHEPLAAPAAAASTADECETAARVVTPRRSSIAAPAHRLEIPRIAS